MTHTNEFLRGMFAAYMGCECEITETQDNITTKTKAKSLGVLSERLHFAGVGLFVHFSKLKPILTPLSEITDEDAVEVAKICEHSHTIDAGKRIVSNIMYYSPINHLHIVDYLRSPYRLDGIPKPVYDLGYMHIPSLIAADLAISSKQI